MLLQLLRTNAPKVTMTMRRPQPPSKNRLVHCAEYRAFRVTPSALRSEDSNSTWSPSTLTALSQRSKTSPGAKSNPLKEVIKNELRASAGVPMSLARFMELGLHHPQHGYYSTKDKIFNKGGDFTTSPEISQMFGESLGIWMIAAMQNNYGGLAAGSNGF